MIEPRDIALEFIAAVVVCLAAGLILSAFHAHPFITLVAVVLVLTAMAVVLFKVLSRGGGGSSTSRLVALTALVMGLAIGSAALVWGVFCSCY